MADLDLIFIQFRLVEFEKKLRIGYEKAGKVFHGLSHKVQQKVQRIARRALRCTIGRRLLGESFREFSFHLADSPLLQQFCEIDTMEPIKVPSKSTLERFEKMVPEEVIRDIVAQALKETGGWGKTEVLGLAEPLDLEEFFVDTTCLQANIHFPVDWVLLRDATRTLMKAVVLIRRQGLKHRMQPPEDFIKQIKEKSIAYWKNK